MLTFEMHLGAFYRSVEQVDDVFLITRISELIFELQWKFWYFLLQFFLAMNFYFIIWKFYRSVSCVNHGNSPKSIFWHSPFFQSDFWFMSGCIWSTQMFQTDLLHNFFFCAIIITVWALYQNFQKFSVCLSN